MIVLVGFMGAGKTTVGRELAARLDVPFFDLDDLVEAAEKMSIKEIFAQHGEPYFRKRERDILRSTRHLEHGVIATGGGTFTFDDNIQFIQSEGLSVYLAAPYSLPGDLSPQGSGPSLPQNVIDTVSTELSEVVGWVNSDPPEINVESEL